MTKHFTAAHVEAMKVLVVLIVRELMEARS